MSGEWKILARAGNISQGDIMPVEDTHAVLSGAEIAQRAALILNGMVRSLVSLPEAVQVNCRPSGVGTVFTLQVAPNDVNLVVGPAERTLRSLRAVVTALGRRSGQRFLLALPRSTAHSRTRVGDAGSRHTDMI